MSTKSMRVIAQEGVRVRNAPRHRAPVVGTLGWNQVLEVSAESRQVEEATGYVWWEHANHPGFWSASGQVGTTDVYMEDYVLPHEEPTPDADGNVRMQVMTNTLSIRTEPRLGDNRVPDHRLSYGQRVLFRSPSQRADRFIWWEQADHPGWWSASGSTSGGQTYMIPLPGGIDEDSELLEVPWITQIQYPVNYKNDCGHACLLMDMLHRGYAENLTVKDLYFYEEPGDPNYYKSASNGCTNTTHLQRMAHKATDNQLQLQVLDQAATLANLETIKASLRADKPVVLLVWYPSLQFPNPSNGNFDHWLVVTGFAGDVFYVNDPLWDVPTGWRAATDSREHVVTGLPGRPLCPQ